ncbi:hypothetical protein NOR_01079 [Metarhizium rileyi]|uniref:Heat-labile enterotoxin, A chain n=1 Tax=Metarhizium rileyi (strain RCEF 4871) TaxID=1649241 RepID=A0A167JR33_METRR|nr:hypothetical protein NOR_01079 [Metarhizium rileyi RCEF 4871]
MLWPRLLLSLLLCLRFTDASGISESKHRDLNSTDNKGKEISTIPGHSSRSHHARMRRAIQCDPLAKQRQKSQSKVSNSPEGEKGLRSRKKIKYARLVESISKSEFIELSKNNELVEFAQKRWSFSATEFRANVIKSNPLGEDSVKLLRGGVRPVGKLSGYAGIALFGLEVVHALAKGASALEWANLGSSLMPIVGCGVHAATSLYRGSLDILDTSLCVVGDVLLLSGIGAPLGVLIHIARFIRSLFLPGPSLPTSESIKVDRDKAWVTFVQDHLYRYIYSFPPINQEEMASDSFGAKLKMSLALDNMAVLATGAQMIGVLNASSIEARENATLAEDEILMIQNATEHSIHEIRAEIASPIARRQRELLINKAINFTHDSEFSPRRMAESFNADFVETMVRSDEAVKRYKSMMMVPFAEPHPWSRYMRAKRACEALAAEVEKSLPRLPSLYEIAFVIGQSKGLAVDMITLSPRTYLRDMVPTLSDGDVDEIAVQQTHAIARLLQDQLNEADLPGAPQLEDEMLKKLRTLVALTIGKGVEEHKMLKWEREKLVGVMAPGDVDYYMRPYFPPFEFAELTSANKIGFLLNMTEAAVDAVFYGSTW